jgi:hypothetical protein
MSPPEVTLGILAVFAVLGVAFKMFSRPSDEGSEAGVRSESAEPETESTGPDQVERLLEELSAGSSAEAAIASNGVTFVPEGDHVYLIPSAHADDSAPTESSALFDSGPDLDAGRGAGARRRIRSGLPSWSQRFDPGDLIGARVVRGAPDFDPWRLEGLGRDRDYQAWPFETEEAARAALALLEGRIIRVPVDEDGNHLTVSNEDFVEARRVDEETEHQFDEEPPIE